MAEKESVCRSNENHKTTKNGKASANAFILRMFLTPVNDAKWQACLHEERRWQWNKAYILDASAVDQMTKSSTSNNSCTHLLFGEIGSISSIIVLDKSTTTDKQMWHFEQILLKSIGHFTPSYFIQGMQKALAWNVKHKVKWWARLWLWWGDFELIVKWAVDENFVSATSVCLLLLRRCTQWKRNSRRPSNWCLSG